MSALITIVTDWLSDIKLGYCSNAWWLNQKFCCWEIENSGKKEKRKKRKIKNTILKHSTDGSCADWTDWGEFMNLGPNVYVVKWISYVLWAVKYIDYITINKKLIAHTLTDIICYNMCLPCQNICPLCCRLGYI